MDIYVLDSKNYAVRMIYVENKLVKLVAGNGKPGYTGDGSNAKEATFGGNENEDFDGPWSLSIDENNNIFVGDTQNHVLRMIDGKTNIINTIAGKYDIELYR